MKTVLTVGIRAISFRKTRVKPGTVLIETVLSEDSLWSYQQHGRLRLPDSRCNRMYANFLCHLAIAKEL